MKFRLVKLVDDFSVLLPLKQVEGLELLRTQMTNAPAAKMIEPMMNEMFHDKRVIKMDTQTWIKMRGLTYFAGVGKAVRIKTAINLAKTGAGGTESDSDDSDYYDDDDALFDKNVTVAGGDFEILTHRYDLRGDDDRAAVTFDNGAFMTAILTWIMSMYALSCMYHGTSSTSVDVAFSDKVATINEGRDNFFLSPVKYWNNEMHTIAYVLPEIRAGDDIIREFIDSAGESHFPHLRHLSTTELYNVLRASSGDVPPDMNEEMESFVDEVRRDKVMSRTFAKLSSVVLSTKPRLIDPEHTLRYVKMQVHYEPLNLFRHFSNLAYNAFPLRMLNSMVLFTEVEGKSGSFQGLVAVAESLPEEVRGNVKLIASHLGQLAAPLAKGIADLTTVQMKQGLAKMSPEARGLIKLAKDGFDLRMELGEIRSKELSERILEAFCIWAPSLFAIVSMAAKTIHGYRRFRKKDMGRLTLDSLDFFFLVIICAQSSLELLAMSSVVEGHYSLGEVAGKQSIETYYTMTYVQLYLQSITRERLGIERSASGEMLEIHRKFIVFLLPHRVKMSVVAGIINFGFKQGFSLGHVILGLAKRQGTSLKRVYDDYRKRQLENNWVESGATLAEARKIPILRDVVGIHSFMHI